MGVGKALKEVRGKESQLKLSFDLNVSRESISAYETERAKIPSDVSSAIVNKYDDPWFAMEVANEYTAGTSVKKLDGEYVDLHRASVKTKTEEELQEAIDALRGISVVNLANSVNQSELEKIRKALLQVIDAIYAASHLVAVLTKEYGFSWVKLWHEHYKKLQERHYVRG
ncbi:helix-turn-helix transcriptional regulator [Tepidibacillus fermentans]|uniref:Helix-turn-helix protein n=1 Tax=Tepidibacillus fermentans TaxID=1281767 RepID=A0A4R3KCJ0_9BACI|nr:helix-turn-helix transcriptional regulator [Tepidibacillus fermentans]TCS80351.1 hypothetical protein EDD72_11718 [Tepidibacillus fermentans]